MATGIASRSRTADVLERYAELCRGTREGGAQEVCGSTASGCSILGQKGEDSSRLTTSTATTSLSTSLAGQYGGSNFVAGLAYVGQAMLQRGQ